MNKQTNYSHSKNKYNNDRLWEICKCFESINNQKHSAFKELFDFTIKNNRSNRKKK